MKVVTIEVKAEVLEEWEKTVLLRLHTGFGNPEVRFAEECVKLPAPKGATKV